MLRLNITAVILLALSSCATPSKDTEYIAKLRATANAGDTEAERTLADYYRLGVFGLRQDTSEEVHWLQIAADKDDAEAQFRLGDLYERGELVKKNYAEAKQRFLLAAARDHAAAELMLGIMYMDGEGVPKNYHEAAYWFQKSAKHGHCSGQFLLGLMYSDGEGGLPHDKIEAYKWIYLGVSRGVDSGRKDLEALTKTMTNNEIAEGKERAAAWLKTPTQCRMLKESK